MTITRKNARTTVHLHAHENLSHDTCNADPLMRDPTTSPAASLHLLRRTSQLLVGLALVAAGVWLGEGYISRLPDHRGFFLVAVEDAVRTPTPPRPRHTVVIVVDGLGLAHARPLRSVARLAAAGQCRDTDVGAISVSRPVYAVLSTGLEQDRTGARNNDETSPLAVESIWEVAREAGLTVSAASDVAWWQQLFPRGFDDYRVIPEADDYFADVPLRDLTLLHPAYIDHAGHAHGSASPAYAEAVARVDRELGTLLDRLDLTQDLVVLTADHGHSATGGHGGPTPEIARVLTCFAGRGVAPKSEAAPLRAHAIAGSLAVLLGLRFPRHMRAGDDDDLDLALEIPATDAFSRAYLEDRRAAVDRFRDANHASIATWLGRPGEWRDLYAAQRRPQWLRAGMAVAVIVAGFALAARLRRMTARAARGLAASFLTVLGATLLLHILVLGSLDWTAINTRARYLVRAPMICAIPAALAIALHAWRLRDGSRLVADQLTFAALALALSLAHIIVFGWPLGFPLPGPTLLLYPFLGAFLVVVHGALAALLAAGALVRAMMKTK